MSRLEQHLVLGCVVLTCSVLAEFTAIWHFVVILSVAFYFYIRRPQYRIWLMTILLTFSWVWLHSAYQQSQLLKSDWQNTKYEVQATIISLPTHKTYSSYQVQRAVVRIEQLMSGDSINHVETLPNMEISWYQNDHEKNHPRLKAGQRWRFNLYVKELRGIQSPNVFDYQRWQMSRGIYAKANVRSAKLIGLAPWTFGNAALLLRQWLVDQLDQSLDHEYSKQLIKTIVLGDKSSLDPALLESLQRIGCAHLLAIYGLHIAMVAGLSYSMAYFCILMFSAKLARPARSYALMFSLLACVGYALLAGFSLPTQRALIIISCLCLGVFLNVVIALRTRLLIALNLVLLIDPWSIQSHSLYLSFLAVLLLGFVFSGTFGRSNGIQKMLSLLQAQWYLLWLMSALSLAFFHQLPVLSILANLILIPVFTLLILPLAFIILLSMSFSLDPQTLFLQWQITLMRIIVDWSVAIAQTMDVVHIPAHKIPIVNSWQLATLILISLLLAILKQQRLLLVYFACVILLFLPRKNPYPLQMHVVDVGQGLSVFIQTQNRVLLYDTGDAFESGFNLMQASVLPMLRKQGIRHIDRLIISHADKDHAGGLAQALESLDVKQVILGDKSMLDEQQDTIPVQVCSRHGWQWGEVQFEIVYANPQHLVSNNRSCVLKITWKEQVIWLTGDITQSAEREIIQNQQHRATVLLAPHHGSKTSSSKAFIQALEPRHVVFSAGYKHRFSHPHPVVVERYKNSGAQLWRTDQQGTISFYWKRDGTLAVEPFVKR